MKNPIRRYLLLLAALSVGAMASAQPAVTVAVTGNAISGAGSAAVNLSALGNENTVTFTLAWDPAVLSYVNDFSGTAAGGATLTRNTSQTSSGRLGLLIGLAPGATFPAGNRQLLVVNFTVVGAGSPSTSVAFVDVAVGFPKKKVFDVKGEAVASATFGDAKIVAHPALPTATIMTLPQNQLAVVGVGASVETVTRGSTVARDD